MSPTVVQLVTFSGPRSAPRGRLVGDWPYLETHFAQFFIIQISLSRDWTCTL